MGVCIIHRGEVLGGKKGTNFFTSRRVIRSSNACIYTQTIIIHSNITEIPLEGTKSTISLSPEGFNSRELHIHKYAQYPIIMNGWGLRLPHFDKNAHVLILNTMCVYMTI